ncbi:MAG: cupin domain-containing protein [Granulosicoccus sp.]
MRLNANFAERAVVHAERLPWVASPVIGVDRRMLDRIGDEVARATSIVRYAPGSAFSPHVHTGGEEFLVLEGVFQDEHGDYPVGSYIRNPPQTSHTPASIAGCTIFVKLWQFNPDDRTSVHVDTALADWQRDKTRSGVETIMLHEDEQEHVCLENWSAGLRIELCASGGLELLVLDGGFEYSGDVFVVNSWLRMPSDSLSTVEVGEQGAKVWIKRGHLAYACAPG